MGIARRAGTVCRASGGGGRGSSSAGEGGHSNPRRKNPVARYLPTQLTVLVPRVVLVPRFCTGSAL
eukprot:79092-Rhodomonas_salina.2